MMNSMSLPTSGVRSLQRNRRGPMTRQRSNRNRSNRYMRNTTHGEADDMEILIDSSLGMSNRRNKKGSRRSYAPTRGYDRSSDNVSYFSDDHSHSHAPFAIFEVPVCLKKKPWIWNLFLISVGVTLYLFFYTMAMSVHNGRSKKMIADDLPTYSRTNTIEENDAGDVFYNKKIGGSFRGTRNYANIERDDNDDMVLPRNRIKAMRGYDNLKASLAAMESINDDHVIPSLEKETEPTEAQKVDVETDAPNHPPVAAQQTTTSQTLVTDSVPNTEGNNIETDNHDNELPSVGSTEVQKADTKVNNPNDSQISTEQTETGPQSSVPQINLTEGTQNAVPITARNVTEEDKQINESSNETQTSSDVLTEQASNPENATTLTVPEQPLPMTNQNESISSIALIGSNETSISIQNATIGWKNGTTLIVVDSEESASVESKPSNSIATQNTTQNEIIQDAVPATSNTTSMESSPSITSNTTYDGDAVTTDETTTVSIPMAIGSTTNENNTNITTISGNETSITPSKIVNENQRIVTPAVNESTTKPAMANIDASTKSQSQPSDPLAGESITGSSVTVTTSTTDQSQLPPVAALAANQQEINPIPKSADVSLTGGESAVTMKKNEATTTTTTDVHVTSKANTTTTAGTIAAEGVSESQ